MPDRRNNPNLSNGELTIRLDQFNSDFEELVRAIKEKRVIFFVGSGISQGTPTNIETAKELSLRLKDKFENDTGWNEYFDPSGPNREERFYDEEFTIPRLEEIAELFLQRNQLNIFIDSVMEEKIWEIKPANTCHFVLSELLIEEFCECVLTINVDDRIEQHHKNIATARGPNIISHDDFLAEREHRNDIYKIHGCLYKCQNKKYQTVWARSQFLSQSWPQGVTFSDRVIRECCQGHHLVFVGCNTYFEYLKRTLEVAIGENNETKLYCVLPSDFDSINPDFKRMINLIPERHIRSRGEDFYALVRQIAFDNLLKALFRENRYLKNDHFIGGSDPLWRIQASEFDEAKESLKEEIIKDERERFQSFLRQVLLEVGAKNKYVSFRYFGDQIARLLFWLILLKLYFPKFTFCTVRYRHLLMHKDNQILKLLIINGDKDIPLEIILQKLNKKIFEDPELLYDIRNVFVYDAIYTARTVKPEEVGTGRLVEREPHTIINASSPNYFVLTDQEIYEFLRNLALPELKSQLDSLSWRS